MNIQPNTHIPFSQLSTSHRFLYMVSATVAIGLLRPWSLNAEEISEDLMRIWDEQKYTPEDVLSFSRMADRLKPHLAKYSGQDACTRFTDYTKRQRRKAAN
jgi:hypothetical protein